MRMRMLVGTAALFSLAGCETAGPVASGGGGIDFAAGAAAGVRLSSADQAALALVFVGAVEQGERGQPYAWKGPRASGAVTPGGYLVGNLWPQPAKVMPLSGRIDLSQPLETELGLYAVAKTANVRAAPLPDAPILTTLPAGTALDVVGKTPGQPWLLAAVGGQIRGYVHESLTVKAPGADLELAGGPTKKPWRCREFKQELTVSGQTRRWTGSACDQGKGWRLVASEAPAVF